MKTTLPSALRLALLAIGFASAGTALAASVTRVDQSAFTAQAGQITFSEFANGTVNPTYTAADYGGGASAPTVTFGGWFMGQHGGSAAECPSGAVTSGCVLGSPTGGLLSLAADAPNTFITRDSANPTSPVLSGSPIFNGPVTVMFSTDQVGVGLEGGYFDAAHSTSIRAYARDGSLIGSVDNVGLGIEFLGLVTADGSAKIAGLQFSLVGPEPAGFAIDNLTFAQAGQVVVPGVPEPSTYAMLAVGLCLLGARMRRRVG